MERVDERYRVSAIVSEMFITYKKGELNNAKTERGAVKLIVGDGVHMHPDGDTTYFVVSKNEEGEFPNQHLSVNDRFAVNVKSFEDAIRVWVGKYNKCIPKTTYKVITSNMYEEMTKK